MNTLSSLQTLVRAAFRSLSASPSNRDQQALETYLGQSQLRSISDLEHCERQWIRDQHTGNAFAAASR